MTDDFPTKADETRQAWVDRAHLDKLKAAHSIGAWIFVIEADGKLHRITDPQWTCPASQYIAVMPLVVSNG